MQLNAVEMNRIVEELPTISAKIRALDAAGYTRADIARFLGKALPACAECPRAAETQGCSGSFRRIR